MENRRQFIVDSGASFHMGSFEDLSSAERRHVKKLEKPIQVTTTNGVFTVKHIGEIGIKSLNLRVEILLFRRAPFLLSVGLLCQKHCEFIWQRGGAPIIMVYDIDDLFMVRKELDVMGNVPYCTLGESKAGRALPAESASEPLPSETPSIEPKPPAETS